MLSDILNDIKPKMEERLSHFTEEIKTIRVGRAESSLVENLSISFYGTTMPLKQMASISAPSPNLITIVPWDKNALGDIELAIKNSHLSLNPTNDGNMIRLSLPPLSEERRKELTKLIHDSAEQLKISLRTIRQDVWQKVVKAERNHEISEDDRYKGEEELNKMIADYNKKIDEVVSQKEKDIMTI
jgi:ribosome recycling factor